MWLFSGHNNSFTCVAEIHISVNSKLSCSSKTVTIASPVESCVPISSPCEKANSVTLTALFAPRFCLLPVRLNSHLICQGKYFLVIYIFINAIDLSSLLPLPYDNIFPSDEIVTTCHGMNFPLL